MAHETFSASQPHLSSLAACRVVRSVLSAVIVNLLLLQVQIQLEEGQIRSEAMNPQRPSRPTKYYGLRKTRNPGNLSPTRQRRYPRFFTRERLTFTAVRLRAD